MSEKNSIVAKHIKAAGCAAGTMLAECKKAAAIAATDLNPALPVGERINAVVAVYADDFKGLDANVKQNFVAFLTIHACASAPVMVKKVVDGETVDTPALAGELLEQPLSKHALRDVAKQVRDHAGIARKSGGGRKAVEKPSVAKVTTGSEAVSETEAFSAWVDNLETYFMDSVHHPKIVARLIELGFTVVKAAKGKFVKGVASA